MRKKGVKLKKFTYGNRTYLYVREMGEDKGIDRLKRVVFGTAALRKKTDKSIPVSSEIGMHKLYWLQLR